MRSITASLREKFARWLLKDVHLPEVKFGKNSISVDPGGVDVIRWTASQPTIQLGDIGMSTVTGRASGFIGGVDTPYATQTDLLGFFAQGGNSFAATAVLGTNDANNLNIRTNSVTRATFDQAGNLVPPADASGQLGTNALRWNLVRAVTITAGASISIDPGGVDVVRWSASQAATALGDLGMSTVSGRASFFVDGAARNAATLIDTQQSVANVAAAPGADFGSTISLQGYYLFVQTLQRWFVMVDQPSPATVDNVTVLTASGGNRRWVWVPQIQNNTWANQWAGQTVVVNNTTGSDENDGVASPLATVAEVTRRLAWAKLSGSLTITTSVLAAGDGPTWVMTDTNGQAITFNGVRTVVRSSTLTAGTATQNPAAAGGGAATILADNTLANWTANLNQLLRVTAGGHLNTCCWVMKDTGGAQITARAGVTRTTTTANGTGTAATIASGDAYNIETPQTMVIGSHQLQNSSITSASITYNDYDLLSGGGGAFVGFNSATNSVSINFNRCRTLATLEAIPRLQNGIFVNANQCLFASGAPRLSCAFPGRLVYTGCSFIGGYAIGNAEHDSIQGDNYIQAGAGANGLTVDGVDGSLNIAGSTGCFDGTNPLAARVGGRMFFNIAGLVWGQGGTGVGLQVLSGMIYIRNAAAPTVTSTTGDFSINLVTTFRAWSETNAAWGPATTCSWANFPATGTMAMDIKGMSGIGLAN